MIAAVIAIATFALILTTIPIAIWTLWVSALLIGIAVTSLALVKYDLIWNKITLLAQSILFAIALLTAISTGGAAEGIPILLLAFVMILGTEQVLSLISNYGAQFSLSNSAPIFNVPTLQRSLDHLYRRLAWDGAIFSAGYLFSVAVVSMGNFLGPVAPALSDISVYVLVTSISLAILIVLKEE